MKKLLGSIIIMLILAQPVSADCAYNTKTISVHIFQEYKDYVSLNIIKKEDEELLENESNLTIDDLSNNMDLVTNLLKLKNETVVQIQNTMNEKAKKREIMNDEQIDKFQEFIKFTQNKESELQSALKNINSKESLKEMQDAIFADNIDYSKLSKEITNIQNAQNIAISSLTSIIGLGNEVLHIL